MTDSKDNQGSVQSYTGSARWELHRQPKDQIADHEFSIWLDGDPVIMANLVYNGDEKHLKAAVDALNAIAQESQQPRWRHKKRGTTYIEVGRGNLQIATDPIEEDDRVVVYRSETDGRLWVRGEAEFQDGRFEALSLSSTERDHG